MEAEKTLVVTEILIRVLDAFSLCVVATSAELSISVEVSHKCDRVGLAAPSALDHIPWTIMR